MFLKVAFWSINIIYQVLFKTEKQIIWTATVILQEMLNNKKHLDLAALSASRSIFFYRAPKCIYCTFDVIGLCTLFLILNIV